MLIQMTDAVKTYGDFQFEASLELQPGRITGLIGRNGAGKTTAMGTILGLRRIEGGEVRIFGKDPMTMSAADKCRIGVTMAENGFSEYLTADAVASIRAGMYPNADKDDFLKLVQQNGLPIDKPIKDFSRGMKAKFHLLCALAHKPDLLILDEPTAGLDVLARDEVLDMLRDFMSEKESRGILISSHISSDLEGLCDDLYMIDQGRIVLHEDTDAILGQYGILKLNEAEYAGLDKRHILYCKKEAYGVSLLTDHKQYYLDNYSAITVENGSIDGVMTLILRGEKV